MLFIAIFFLKILRCCFKRNGSEFGDWPFCQTFNHEHCLSSEFSPYVLMPYGRVCPLVSSFQIKKNLVNFEIGSFVISTTTCIRCGTQIFLQIKVRPESFDEFC